MCTPRRVTDIQQTYGLSCVRGCPCFSPTLHLNRTSETNSVRIQCVTFGSHHIFLINHNCYTKNKYIIPVNATRNKYVLQTTLTYARMYVYKHARTSMLLRPNTSTFAGTPSVFIFEYKFIFILHIHNLCSYCVQQF